MNTARGPGVSHDETDRAAHAERRVATAFAVTIAAALALAVVYWRGGQPQAEGVLLAVALGGLAYGIVTWAHVGMPTGEVVGEREDLASADPERRGFTDDLEAGTERIGRRGLLGRMLGAAVGALGLAAGCAVRLVLAERHVGARAAGRIELREAAADVGGSAR